MIQKISSQFFGLPRLRGNEVYITIAMNFFLQIFRIKRIRGYQGYQGYRGYGGYDGHEFFSSFFLELKGYEVTKVTRVTGVTMVSKGPCPHEIQGYEVTGLPAC